VFEEVYRRLQKIKIEE